MTNRTKLFKLGKIVVTLGAWVNHTATDFNEFLVRHVHGDWGDVGKPDKQANEEAVATGGRIVSVYGTGDSKLWIITEADRSVTTILRPDEY